MGKISWRKLLDYLTRLRNPEYLNAKLDDLYFSQMGIDSALKKYDLDAILFPSYIGSTIFAKAGYPSIAIPAGYMESGRPFGITLASTAFSEGILIKLAYAFEQATNHRKCLTRHIIKVIDIHCRITLLYLLCLYSEGIKQRVH